MSSFTSFAIICLAALPMASLVTEAFARAGGFA